MSEADPLTEPTSRRDFVAVRHPHVRHPVQGRAPHQQLSGLTLEAARARPLPEDHLEAEDRHLRQRAPVIVILSLPLRAAVAADKAQVLITVVWLTSPVAVVPDARALLGWDDRPGLARADGVVTLPVVVTAVSRHLLEFAP